MIRKCLNCGKEFEVTPFTKSKIYCGDKCKRKFNRKRERYIERKRWKNRVLTGVK